jgi:hypothetical protein
MNKNKANQINKNKELIINEKTGGNIIKNDLPNVEFVDPSDIEESDVEIENIIPKNIKKESSGKKLNPNNIKENNIKENNIKENNIKENNIKEIKLNIDDVIVSSNNSNENNFEEKLEISNLEIITKDDNLLGHEIFVRIMENDMLRDVPVSLQSNKMIQEEIRKKVEQLYQLKEKGDNILSKEKEDGYLFNENLENLKEGKFSKIKWVYPVVLDQHVIYAPSCDNKKKIKNNIINSEDEDEDEEEDEKNSLTLKSGEVPYGDIMEDQFFQMKEIQSLYNKKKKGEIKIASFYSRLAKQREPYKSAPDTYWDDSDVPKARDIKLTEYSEMYRYINLNNIKIKNRVGKGPTVIPLSLPEKKEKVESFITEEIVSKKIITVDSGELVNIVGFLFIPEVIKNIKNKGYSQKQLEDYREFSENKKNLIKEAYKRKLFLNDDTNFELDKPYLILFEYAPEKNNHIVNSEEYLQMLKKVIPLPEDVVDFIIKNNEDLDIYNFNQSLKKWGYKIGTITYDSWQKAKDIIVKSASKELPAIITGFKPEDIGTICKIGENELLRDTQYNSELMRLLYRPNLNYTADLSKSFRGIQCDIQRINSLFQTDDNGLFYYTYSFYDLRQKSSGLNNSLKNLEQIRKKLISEIGNLNKKQKDSLELNNSTEFEILDVSILKQQFDKLLTDKDYNLNETFKRKQKLVEVLNKIITNYGNKTKDLETFIKQEAALLVVYYMSKTSEKIDKDRLTDIKLGKLLYEKEFENTNINNNKIINVLEETPFALTSILRQLNRLESYSRKKQLLYSIIQLDGILINKYIYSIFYKKPLLCGHWYYQMLVDSSDSVSEKNKWISEFLSIYGDDGESTKGEESCVVCGAFLDRTKLVESMYIDESGNPLILREYQVDEERKTTYFHSLPAIIYDIISSSVKNCKSDEFKQFLKKRKITEIEDLKKAKLACDLMTGILTKMDIDLKPRPFIELVIVCVRESRKITGLESYYNEKLKELKIKNKLSNEQIKKLESSSKYQNKLLKSYYGYFIVRYGTLVLAHLLWHLRTSIPQYIPGENSTTSCSFFGYDGDGGFDYIVCVVMESKMLKSSVKIEGVTVSEIVSKNKVDLNLKYWVQTLEPNYNYALIKKQNYVKENELFNKRVGSYRNDRIKEEIKWGEEDVTILEEKEEIIKKLTNVLKSNKPEEFNLLFNNIIFEIRKRSFKIRSFLNNFINNSPKTDFGEISVYCCEQNIEVTGPFINYFIDIDENIVKMSKDLFRLQFRYNILSSFLETSQYFVATYQLPIINMNKVPINILDVPNNFITSAYTTFCHEGPSRGEKHFFENKNFPEIQCCIKCNWYLKKLKDTQFSREEFVNLMNDVDKKTLVNHNLIKTSRDVLNQVSLKRESSSDKIKEDIYKLAQKISLKVSGGNKKDKEIYKKIENFLKNIDNFKNFIPDLVSSPLNYPQVPSEKDKIETITRRNKFVIQKMKEYINEYFRKNVSRIKQGYKIKNNINTPWVPKKDDEKWQKIIIDKNTWLETFLTKTNEKLFKKFKFSFTIDNINSIIGIQSIYGNDYKRLIRTSLFTLDDAIRVLKHYFIKEMLKFLELSESGEPIVADFYMKLFDEIEKDRNIINLSEKEIAKWADSIEENNILTREKYFKILGEEGSSLFNSPLRQFRNDIYSDPLFNPKLVTNEDVEKEEKEAEDAEQEQYFKEEAFDNLKDDANEQSIHDYVQDSIENELINDEINEEIYDNSLNKEGEDIMDAGYDYGDQGQGIENE